MSNGDETEDDSAETPEPADPATFESGLDEAAEAVEQAETEADLDDADELLDDIEADLEDAVFEVELEEESDEDEAESDEDEEEEENPRDGFEDRVSELRDDIEDQRGPYIEEVTDSLDSAVSTITGSEWAKEGERELTEAAETYVATASEVLESSYAVEGDDPETVAEKLADVSEDVADSGLHPDTDEPEIQELLDGTQQLESDLDDATLFTDLEVREQLRREGFYDVLDPENRKDFPPEWSAIKLYEKRGEVEPILSALDKFDSDFMQENILDALEHMAPVEAFEAVQPLAQRRDKQAIRVLGRIGDDRACATLHNFLGGRDVELEKTTLRSLGMIGSEESLEPVAETLAADSPEIRSAAARTLGLLGDTRAIDPLAERLAEDDADEVRASAAWALNQIGTERALDAAAEYSDDRAYIVQAEAEKAK